MNPLDATAIANDVKWVDRLNNPAPMLPNRCPVAWQTFVNTFYNAPLLLQYHNLAPTVAYSVHVVYVNPTVYLRDGGAADNATAAVGSTPKPDVTLYANDVQVHGPVSPPVPTRRLVYVCLCNGCGPLLQTPLA